MASLLLQSQSLTHLLPQNLFHEPRKSPACPPCPVNLGLTKDAWWICLGENVTEQSLSTEGKRNMQGAVLGASTVLQGMLWRAITSRALQYRNAPGWLPSLQRDSPVRLTADGHHSRWEVITPRERPQTRSLRSWLKGCHVRWAAVLARFTSSTLFSHLWA